MSIDTMTIEWKLREQYRIPASLAAEIAAECRFARYARDEIERLQARAKSLEQYAPADVVNPPPPAPPVYHRRSKWD